MAVTDTDLAARQPLRIRADPTRVIAKLFVSSRLEADARHHVADAVTLVLGLDEDEVSAGLGEIVDRFAGRATATCSRPSTSTRSGSRTASLLIA